MQTILIAEDKESMSLMLREALQGEGYEAIIASDGSEAVNAVKKCNADMVITDLRLPGRDWIEVLRASKEDSPLRPVIVMTAHGSVNAAVSAMKEGAFDFITKPFDIDHLLMLVRRALDTRRLQDENLLLNDELSRAVGLPDIIGRSEGVLELARQCQRVAPARTTVLLLGESGTGKELFARAIHNLSPRRDYPFVPINCAAIPHNLLESELFGYEKGAFSGAEARKPGKFELAHMGTVFLDEVGEMDVTLQAKLLRAIQEGEVERVGGTRAVKVDIRVIAASNRDLTQAIAARTFREDLYYRLNVFPLRIPPLRERPEDIPLLAMHFTEKYSRRLGVRPKKLDPDAVKLLGRHTWKGNVRELENAIERAVILCDGDIIMPAHIAPETSAGGRQQWDNLTGTLEEVAREAVTAAESARIRKALDETGWNRTRAAEALSVSYKTLLTKIRDYGITS